MLDKIRRKNIKLFLSTAWEKNTMYIVSLLLEIRLKFLIKIDCCNYLLFLESDQQSPDIDKSVGRSPEKGRKMSEQVIVSTCKN